MDLSAFHFLYPAWLIALVPLWALVAWAARRRGRDGNWSNVIDPDLLPAMRLDSGPRDRAPWWVFAVVWSLASIALAGPTWQRDESPAFRSPHDWIVVFDLSPSMDRRDVTPDRVTRARYLIDDILGAVHDARVGLIVFAGDAHAVTPLTSDVENVRALLQPLTPGLLPVPGDDLAPALDEASTLLRSVASRDAEVVVLTDGFADTAQALKSAAALAKQGATVNVIGIGNEAGVSTVLQQLATAGHGEYASLSDARQLIARLQEQQSGELASIRMDDMKLETWRNEGIWFLAPLALLAALIARRGWV